jgi:hypothetical protein
MIITIMGNYLLIKEIKNNALWKKNKIKSFPLIYKKKKNKFRLFLSFRVDTY